jgi:hemoglobin
MQSFTKKRVASTMVALLAATMPLLSGCGGQEATEERAFSTSGGKEADQRADQRMAKDAQLKGGNEDQTSLGNKIKGDEKTGPQGVPLADEKKTLYDRLGGDEGISAITEDFLGRALADPRVNWERKGIKRGGLGLSRNESVEWKPDAAKMDKLKLHIKQFIALATGGPTTYEGGEMKNVHAGMRITNAEFDATVGDLKATLDKLQIPNQEQKELLAVIETTRTQVVSD